MIRDPRAVQTLTVPRLFSRGLCSEESWKAGLRHGRSIHDVCGAGGGRALRPFRESCGTLICLISMHVRLERVF